MAIDKKLIFWKKQSTFNAPSSTTDTTGSVMWYSIVFFKDTGQIWTNGTYYNCGIWGTPQTNYVPLTIGGTSYNLSRDGHTHNGLFSTPSGTSNVDLLIGNTGEVKYYYNVNIGSTNLFPSTNNANAILAINNHMNGFNYQLGFSSNGNMYQRSALPTNFGAWRTILDSVNTSWGTPTAQYSPLTINSVTRNLSLDGHTHSSFLNLELKNIQGGDINHRLELGYSGVRDYVNWYEYGGLWKFIQRNNEFDTELFQINTTNILYRGNAVWHTGNFNPTNYLPLSGGTLTGLLKPQNIIFGSNTYDLSWGGFTNGKATINGNGGLNIYPLGNLFSGDVTINGHKVWHAGNDGAGSGLDADLLDGVHYQNILERRHSGSSASGTATGWFRISELIGSNAGGHNCILTIKRSYNYADNESYVFSISGTYNGGISITQLSGYANTRLIDKIRVDYINSGAAYIELHIATSTPNNSYGWTTIGTATSYTTWTAVSDTPNGTSYEFTTVNGCKSDRGFTGNLSGNSSSATKLQTTRTIWGQNFNGEGNVSGSINNVIDIIADTYLIKNSTTNPYLKLTLNGLNWYIQAYQDRLYYGYGVSNSLNIDSSGNVGINTTSSSSYKLDVNGNVNATRFFSTQTTGTSPFTVSSTTLVSNLNADMLDGAHQTSFLRCDSIDAGDPKNANYAIGTDSTHNFIQSHASKPLHLNELGNYVYINNVLAATINSNVASATKLQNTRTIWGQNFNGEGDVDGTVFTNIGVKSRNICIETDNLGNAGSLNSEINNFNYNLYLQYSTANNTIICNGGGNVGIGTTSPSYKLDVNGTFRSMGNAYINGVLRSIYEGGPLTGAIVSKSLAYNLNPYGLITRIYGSGVVSLQSQRESNDSETFGLTLQPLGGNVLISTTTDSGYKLDVNGTGRFTGNVTAPTFIGNLTGNASSATYSPNSSKLYSTDEPYKYSGIAPYYGYITYNNGLNVWDFKVSPNTPENVRVYMSDRLTNTRTIWGQNFNGEGNVSGAITNASTGNFSSTLFTSVGLKSRNICIETDNTGNSGTQSSEINNYNSSLFLQASTSNNVVLVFGGGSVGIGTTSTSYKLDVNGNGRFTDSLSASRVIAGYDSGIAGSVSCSNWFRSSGESGWYSQSYGGGIHMEDSTYVKVYGSKSFKVNSTTADSINTSGGILAGGLRVAQTDGGGKGISLYDASYDSPQYGLMFAQTVYKGAHGAVNGDWATYFTMSPDAGRGWIFTSNAGGSGGNVASISNTGNMSLNGYLQVQGGSSVPGIKSSYYGNIGMYFGDKLQYQSTSGIKEFIMTTRLYNINPANPTYTQYNRVPVILWHGRVTISSSTVTFLMYNSGGISLTGSRLNEGTATITMNAYSGALLPNSYSEYMVVATGLGTPNTTGSTAFVTIPDTYKYATNFRIVIADDITANDGYAEIMIIKVMDPAYYAS